MKIPNQLLTMEGSDSEELLEYLMFSTTHISLVTYLLILFLVNIDNE